MIRREPTVHTDRPADTNTPEPARLLREYVRDHEADLAVVATHGRSGRFDLLLGSVAGRIVASVETDPLRVRAVQASAARETRESDAKQ